MKGDKELIIKKCEELGFELIDENLDYDKNRREPFMVKCLECGNISTKSFDTLVKNSAKCRFCFKNKRDYKNSLNHVIPKIMKACEDNDYTFIGFEGGEWKKCRDIKELSDMFPPDLSNVG